MASFHIRDIAGRSRTAISTIGLAALFVAGPFVSAALADCGDDVAGKRVACGCGDRVVSDTRLQRSDPIVSERCYGHGLLVRAKPGAPAITLNLGGFSISGSGYGAGLRVAVGGGDGAVILGGDDGQQAEIVGFDMGIQAHEAKTIQRLGRIAFKGNKRHGAWLRCMNAELFELSASSNSGDGLRLRGRNVLVRDLDSHDNLGAGLVLTGATTTVSGTVHDNTGAGAVSSGKGHDLTGLLSSDNGEADRRRGLVE